VQVRTTSKLFRRCLIAILLTVFVTLPQGFAFAWGNEGHTYINQVAAQKIPATMPLFLRQATVEIAYLGPEPDRWRNPTELSLKNAQEPDHFIDLERVAWLDPLPQVRYESIANFTKSGRQPRITLTTIFPSTSVFSLISLWKFMAV